jgi:hypothetical protein
MQRHLLFWLLIIALVFVFGPLFVAPKGYERILQSELDAANQHYARSEVHRVIALAKVLYQFALVDTGVDESVKKYMIKQDSPRDEIAPGVQLPKHLTTPLSSVLHYWQSLLYQFYLFSFRLAHACVWLLYLTPFFVAVVFDGIMVRSVKIETMKYTSPTIQNWSWHVMLFLVCMSLVVFATAVPINIFYYPLVMSSCGVLFRLVLGNIQHSA